MGDLYDDAATTVVPKAIKLNDCMKGSKKLGVNNEHIQKMIKTKEHTKTWIKNVETAAKGRNDVMLQPLQNMPFSVGAAVSSALPINEVVVVAATPLPYLPNLPVTYQCSCCHQPLVQKPFTVQYHPLFSTPYVVLCAGCGTESAC